MHVDAADQRRLLLAGFGQPVIGQQLEVAVGHVRQRLGRRARVGAGHVGHAIVGDAFLDEDRVVVRRRARGLGAAALVDGDIHQHAARPHPPQHVAA